MRTLRSACAHVLGTQDYSFRHANRRQSAYGRVLLPAMVSPKPKVAVVVDTSGSMQAKELSMGVSEATGIVQAVGGQIEVCSADAVVQATGKVSSAEAIAKLMKGGGGTSFIPAFKALVNDRPMHRRPNVIVYVTDGYGTAPATAPPGVRVIWLLTPGGRSPATWGETIRIEEGS